MRFTGMSAVLAAAMIALAGCSSGSGPAAAAGTPARPTPTIAAPCLIGDERHAAHFPGVGGGGPIEGYLAGDGPVGIVLAHQAGADLCQWRSGAIELAAKGYRVLAITMDSHLDQDVVAAAGYLRDQGAQKVVLIGASMGGTAVLAAAGRITPPPAAVVSLSGPTAYLGADALSSVRALDVPVLYFAGEKDLRFADDARTLYAATGEQAKTLHVFPDDPDHGVDLWAKASPEIYALLDRVTKA